MPEKDPLKEYREKRDFARTAEPEGGEAKEGQPPVFVVQKHDASRLHYDFRLEVDGVLKSWAVPKGPSTDPSEKRLAVPTEDHPLDYADFEGVIPEGQYGGGTVLVWDIGPYRNLRKDDEGNEIPMEDACEGGQVEVWLEGQKLRGCYVLVRTKRRQGDKPQWLLIKKKDDHADARRNPVSTEPASVLSGRTIEQVAEQEGGKKGQ
ncbi:MAG: DNA ligase [Phycisphaerae bacterium]|nr:DNA ligase [Phycisphaerae bacterium]